MGTDKNIKLHIVTDIKMITGVTELFSAITGWTGWADGYKYPSLIVLVIILAVRRWINQKIDLNCWFCGHVNRLHRFSKLWWMCNVCEQYNGFKNDGSYVKEIPEMFNESNKQARFCEYQKAIKTTNLLCSPCLNNQNRIIQALADFSPSNDNNFDDELDDYKRDLDSRYGLCIPCKTGVAFHLHSQDKQIQQSHNNNVITQKKEKGLRRLDVNLSIPNVYMLALYKLTHVLSFLAGMWLCRQVQSDTKSDIILNISLIFTTVTILLYLRAQKCDLVGIFVSILWLLVLAYGNFKTRDSRYLLKLTLSVVVFLEGLYLCYHVLLLISKLWKSVTYKKERREKVEKMKYSPKGEASSSSSSKEVNTIGTLKEPASHLDVQSNSENTVRRPSTPDILEGHLDAMFIQRKEHTDYLPAAREAKDTNHVVSALKYRAATNSQSNHRVPGQVLKPATFSGNLLRPAIFVSPISNLNGNQNKNVNTFSKKNASQTGKQDKPLEQKPLSEPKNVVEDQARVDGTVIAGSSESQTRICSCINVVILFFTLSLLGNLILAYKLASGMR